MKVKNIDYTLKILTLESSEDNILIVRALIAGLYEKFTLCNFYLKRQKNNKANYLIAEARKIIQLIADLGYEELVNGLNEELEKTVAEGGVANE